MRSRSMKKVKTKLIKTHKSIKTLRKGRRGRINRKSIRRVKYRKKTKNKKKKKNTKIKRKSRRKIRNKLQIQNKVYRGGMDKGLSSEPESPPPPHLLLKRTGIGGETNGWYGNRVTIDKFLEVNVGKLIEAETKKVDYESSLKHQKEILIADFTNYNRMAIYTLIHLLNVEIDKLGHVIVSGGDGFNSFLSPELRAISPDIDVKCCLTTDEAIQLDTLMLSEKLTAMDPYHIELVNTVIKQYMVLTTKITKTMRYFVDCFNFPWNVDDSLQTPDQYWLGKINILEGEGSSITNLSSEKSVPWKIIKGLFYTEAPGIGILNYRSFSINTDHNLTKYIENILPIFGDLSVEAALEICKRKLNRHVPIFGDEEGWNEGLEDIKKEGLEDIKKKGLTWAIRTNEMEAGGPADKPFTLNNVKLISIDCRYHCSASYFNCLAGVLDVVISVPGHIGFMKKTKGDYLLWREKPPDIPHLGAMPFPALLVYFITPEYYKHESQTMIDMGVRSANGKIVKDYDRIYIMIDNFLIEVPEEAEEIVKFLDKLLQNINGTPIPFQEDLKKIVELIVLATNAQLVTKLTCEEYSTLPQRIHKQMAELIVWPDPLGGGESTEVSAGGGSNSINNQYGGAGDLMSPTEFVSQLKSLQLPFLRGAAKEIMAERSSQPVDVPDEPGLNHILNFLRSKKKFITLLNKNREYVEDVGSGARMVHWMFRLFSVREITDDDRDGILDDFYEINVESEEEEEEGEDEVPSVQFSQDSLDMLNFKYGDNTITDILREYLHNKEEEEEGDPITYDHLPLKSCLCYNQPSVIHRRGGGGGGGKNNKLVKKNKLVKINNQCGGDGSQYSKIINELFGGNYEAFSNMGINSGSMGDTFYKKLGVYPFLENGLDGFSDSINAPRTYFYLNPKQLKETKRTKSVVDLWRPEDNPFGVNFEKFGKDVLNLELIKSDDYLTTSMYKLFQLDTEVNGFENGISALGNKIPFQLRKILTTNSEKQKMITLMNDINRILENSPGFIHHLAQFKAYREYLTNPEDRKPYAEYILYSLIPSFNPIKLELQKKIFAAKKLKGLNLELLTQIKTFHKQIEDIANK